MPDVDTKRVERYLATVRENTEDIRGLVTRYDDDQILRDRYLLKAFKYCLIEIAEAMADTLQHMLARTKGLAAESYLELVEKAAQSALLDAELLGRLRFFFKFRNMLVHRYWEIEDQRLLHEARKGLGDFDLFIETVKAELAKLPTRQV
jgi:uncharacterized protein YutE (UPF0331/DUF86 family)